MLKNSQDARGQHWWGSIPNITNLREHNDYDEYVNIDCAVSSNNVKDDINRASAESENINNKDGRSILLKKGLVGSTSYQSNCLVKSTVAFRKWTGPISCLSLSRGFLISAS